MHDNISVHLYISYNVALEYSIPDANILVVGKFRIVLLRTVLHHTQWVSFSQFSCNGRHELCHKMFNTEVTQHKEAQSMQTLDVMAGCHNTSRAG